MKSQNPKENFKRLQSIVRKRSGYELTKVLTPEEETEQYLRRKLLTARVIADFVLICFTGIKSIIDLGCGYGQYLAAFKERGLTDLKGVEIKFDHPPLPEVEPCIQMADLSKPYDAGRLFDLAICLEVIEHIDPKHTDTVVHNIIRHSAHVLFSGANLQMTEDPGHVNLKQPSEWIRVFNKHDYALWVEPTLDLRGGLPYSVDWWIPRNVLVFKRIGC